MKTKIYRIKEGKKEKLLAWANELKTTYKNEVFQTLQEENVEREFAGIFHIDGKSYAVGFVMGENMLPSSPSELNQKHKEVLKDCLELPTSVEVLYDFLAS